ncbi:uncharacterized protein METZ01_LOCUS246440, partial [marine metagenome]
IRSLYLKSFSSSQGQDEKKFHRTFEVAGFF